MKVSGKELADKILSTLKAEIADKQLQVFLAIALANQTQASKLYVENKVKRAEEIGMNAKIFKFESDEFSKAILQINTLSNDPKVNGIIIQYPVYESWDFVEISNLVDSTKDVDGFKKDSPFIPATAAAVWEMLSEFSRIEGFSTTEEFLNGKKITILGRGKTAGAPTRELLEKRGFIVELIHSKTENPNQIIKSSDVVISATGKRHILDAENIKSGAYVIGVGVGRDDDGTYGDIDEKEVSDVAKLYCPTIGGIGPLTIACLLRNVVQSAKIT